ncbi:hypothetical protein DS830_06555 [Bombilactobacillus bombi]|uniref:hypothetical protein n=1 Tax=Bombilactobacillus bombi TaxID=1303590 RepID=UPI000E57AA29|nr:hypothetical protein [Bombilactobacillus bombi]AXX65156.1 hypothetical protein DS830_06555 [Bombilactobacillus bombi]
MKKWLVIFLLVINIISIGYQASPYYGNNQIINLTEIAINLLNLGFIGYLWKYQKSWHRKNPSKQLCVWTDF